MGSCSNKGGNQNVNSINTIPTTQNDVKKPSPTNPPVVDAQKKPEEKLVPEVPNSDKQKYTISIVGEEHKERKSRKQLTVISTNNDNFEIPSELSNEISLVRQKSFGKKEQGSLLVANKPILFGGRLSPRTQNEFEEKVMMIEGEDVKRDHLLLHGAWVACKKGLKPESPNQDDYVVMIEPKSMLLGVFDGHGSHGHEVSNYIHNAFPKVLASHDLWVESPIHAISDAFLKVHNDLTEHCKQSSSTFDCILSGSTATIVYLRPHKLYVGHAGDSRAVMAKMVNGKLTAMDLTRDHKPTLEDEHARIYRMGGDVRKIDNEPPYRVFFKNKQYPGIAMSRTIGDSLAQTVGVVCNAEVNEIDLTQNDQFVVLCSDGVWEFISSQEAVDEISKYGNDVKSAATALATLAWNKWIDIEGDMVDDITVVIAYLKDFTSN